MREKRIVLAVAMGWTDIEPLEYWSEGWGWDAHVKSFKGRRPDGIDDHEVPDIEHDIAAGLAALDATGAGWSILRHEGLDCDCTIYNTETGQSAIGSGTTPAEACCAALIAYYEGKG